MDLLNKKILFINLTDKTYDLKSFVDLNKYIGGIGLGLKLMDMYKNLDPVIFAIGPLNGFFPFVSKTAAVFIDEGSIEDIYLGGYLSTRIKFSGLDAILIYGKSDKAAVLDIQNNIVNFKDQSSDPNSLGLPGKRSMLVVSDKKMLLDEYFEEYKRSLNDKLKSMKLSGMTITGTQTFTLKNMDKYNEVYKEIMEKTSLVDIEKGFFPSCSGCPMGCEKSIKAERGGNVLVHSLVACEHAKRVYSDVGTVFSCLNVLGYDYTHEDIENFNYLITEVLKDLT